MHARNATLAAGCFLSLAAGLASAQPTYRLTDLGTLGGGYSLGLAINDSGRATGYANTTNNARQHAFLWDGSTMQDLGIGTLGGRLGAGTAINATGQVTGYANTTNDAEMHAFLWDGVATQDLGTLGGKESLGHAINSSGQVTGTAGFASDVERHAFLWDGSTMRDLGTLGGTLSQGNAVNDSGQVTGEAYTINNGASHAFLWDGTSMKDLSLGSLGAIYSTGMAINASGQVTGFVYINDLDQHAFLWDGTTTQDLGTFGGTDSQGNAINDSGQVTGVANTTGDSERHAFLWDGTTMRDLGTLIHPADPLQPYVTLVESRDLNDSGQVLASGCDSRTGECHAYIVSPLDTTPDAFKFASQAHVTRSAEITSNAVTITGLEAAAQISVIGGEYSVGCTGTFTASDAMISDGETVCVRLIASSAAITTTTATLNVGGVSGSFSVTTIESHGGGGAIGFATLLPLLLFLRRRNDLERTC